MSCSVSLPIEAIVAIVKTQLNITDLGGVKASELSQKILAFIQPKLDLLQDQINKMGPEKYLVDLDMDDKVLTGIMNDGTHITLDMSELFGALEDLHTNEKTSLVKAINEVFDNTKDVAELYKQNVLAGAGAYGWVATLIIDGDKTQAQINAKQKQTNDNYLSKLSNELYIDDYIAKAATIRDAFIAALTDLKNIGGGTLNLGKGKSYLIFTSTSGSSTNILDFDQLKNVTVNFNGSEIVVDTSNVPAVPRIFHLKNPKNITFNDVRVRDVAGKGISGTSPPNHWGPDFVRITTDDTVATKDKGGIVINNIDAYSCDAIIVVDGYNGTQWQTQTEFKGIDITGRVKLLNCYYGACFINAGDDFTGVLHGENVRRLYYPCGVKNHSAVVTSKGNGLSANAGSTANVLLKSGDRPLSNIDVNYKYDGMLSHVNLIAFVIQPDTAGNDAQDMSNVRVIADFTEANSDYFPDSIAAFRCYAGASTTEQTVSNHCFKNITVDINDPSEQTGVLKSNEFVLFGASTTRESTVIFPRSQPKIRLLKEGWVLRNRAVESRFILGGLDGKTIKIPFANDYYKTHQFFAKISVTCINPIGVQRIYHEEYVVMGSVSSAGAMRLANATKTLTYNSGTALTITIAGATDANLLVDFTGAGSYNDANCHCRVDFELIDSTQRRLF